MPTNTVVVVPNPTASPTVVAGAPPAQRTVTAFARYVLQPSSVNPSVPMYSVQPDLANVTNAKNYELSPGLKALIVQNGFGAQATSGDFRPKQFYQLYESIRYEDNPVFVSTDSVLHVYHLMFDKLLRSTETNFLIDDLKEA